MVNNEIKRVVLLFGAGAARPWDGPSTKDVTDLILGRYKEDELRHTDAKVVNLIFKYLENIDLNSTLSGQVNFEGIISLIEELILFYNEKEKGSSLILSNFFNLKPEFRIELESCFSNSESHFQNLINTLNDVLLSITDIVYKYSKRIVPSENEVDLVKLKNRLNLNELFDEWILRVYSNKNILRSYTLNYENIFKILLEKSLNKEINNLEKIDIFEGLGEQYYESEIERILFDRNCNCHFNLHGSIFWHVEKYHRFNAFEDPHFCYRKFPDVLGSSNAVISEVEVGRPFVFSNIIAGYKKSQRSFSTPFKQMHSSFEMDCLTCDELYIIGYSFSDVHINFGVNSAIRSNKNCKIKVIDPSFKNDLSCKMNDLIKRFPSIFDIKKIAKDVNKPNSMPKSFFQGRLEIYPLSFEEFLKIKK